MVSAITSSGEATKACVFGLPSARFAKFRLNDVTIEFGRVVRLVPRPLPDVRPQVLAITVPFASSSDCKIPSRSAV